MARPENVIDSRLANALIADTSASPEALASVGRLAADATLLAAPNNYIAPFTSRLLPKIMNRELDWFKTRQGGLWVGGKAVLSSLRLTFRANAVNEAFHSAPNDLNWSVPLAEIVAVHVRRGIITDIVDVLTDSRTRSFRCFKAKAFAAQIEAASLAQRHQTSGSA